MNEDPQGHNIRLWSLKEVTTQFKQMLDDELFQNVELLIQVFYQAFNDVIYLYPSQNYKARELNLVDAVGFSLGGGYKLKLGVFDGLASGIKKEDVPSIQQGIGKMEEIMSSLHPVLHDCGMQGFITNTTEPGRKPAFPSPINDDVQLEVSWGITRESSWLYSDRIKHLNWGSSDFGRERIHSYRFKMDPFAVKRPVI